MAMINIQNYIWISPIPLTHNQFLLNEMDVVMT